MKASLGFASAVVTQVSFHIPQRPLGRTGVAAGRKKLNSEFGLFRLSLPVRQIQVEEREPAIQLLAVLNRSDKHNAI